MRCNVCQTANEDQARFCVQCGSELATQATAPLPPPSAADPLWAQTVGSDPGGPMWHEPAPLDDPQPTQQNETLPTITDMAAVRAADFATVQQELRMTVAAELAERRRRNRLVVAICSAVVLLVGAVIAIVAFTGDSDSTTSPGSTDPTVVTSTTAVEVTTVPTTVPVTTVPPTTVVATTVPVTTVPPTSVSPSTVAPTTVVPTTVPVVVPPTAAPTTTPATATTPATNPPTTVPATTAAPSTSTVTSIPPNGDLGLDRPISKPACDGKFITLIGSSVDPNGYAIQVKSILDLYPTAKYLRTELVCSSLRAKSAAGNAIYVVFFGPYASKQQACDARADGTDGAYVKVLDTTSDPGAGVNCG